MSDEGIVSTHIASFSMTLTGDVSDELRDLLLSVPVTYDLLFGSQVKAVIESMDDMQRLASGEAVEVNWYCLENGEWQFVERRALQFHFKGKAE